MRIGRRRQIERNCAIERLSRDLVEVGKKTVLARGREKHSLASSRARSCGISRIKWIRHQDRRRAFAWADITRGSDGCEKQPLAAAVENENFAIWIDGAG